MKFYTYTFFALSLSLAVFIATKTPTAHAQTGIPQMIVATIELTPKFPTPGDVVKATLNAPTIDIDSALITWTLNGKVIQKAYSNEIVTFSVGEVGDVYEISVTAESGNMSTVSAKKTIRISDVAIVWEGKTYIPPFYKGRALQSAGASVAIIALPSIVNEKGILYSASELVYVWSTNYSLKPSNSGKGMNSIILLNDQPQEEYIITLQIKDPKGDVRAVKKIVIPISHPTVLLYENSPLIGIRYDSALNNEIGVYSREATVVAEPYYISATTRTSPVLEYLWTIDGTTYTNAGNLTFAPTENSANGSSYLDIVIKNTKQWLQNGRASLTINFGQRNIWSGLGVDTNTP